MSILQTERRGPVLLARINAPERRNALNPDFYDAFRNELQSTDAAAVVLAGAGRFFSAGGDVHGLRQRLDMTPNQRRASVDRLHAMIVAIRRSPLPVIAAVEGGAAGAGASLAMACDLLVMASNAYLSVAYVRIGLTPDGGSTKFLTDALPRQLAAEMALTGGRVFAPRLNALGLVNRVSEPGEVESDALALAAELAEGPPRALGRIKRLLAEAPERNLEGQLEDEARSIAEALGGKEAREGVTAFLEKRKPDFRGG